jgi:AraC family transcriptional regulator, regulatory protein of adaptative response / DNA-3-methyladenine glycosylase II
VARALKLIDQGLLAEAPLGCPGRARAHVGERQLRRLFVERLGAPPIGVHGTRRLLFAKQLLTETALPVTQVAMAAGFGSLRRFNDSFRAAYRMAPRELRREPRADRRRAHAAAGVPAAVRLRGDAGLPAGPRAARGRAGRRRGYARAFGSVRRSGLAARKRWTRARRQRVHALRLELHGAPAGELLGIVSRVRRMFDLDADPRRSPRRWGRSRLRPLCGGQACAAQRLGRLRDRGARGDRPAGQRRRRAHPGGAARAALRRAAARGARGAWLRARLFPTPQALVDADSRRHRAHRRARGDDPHVAARSWRAASTSAPKRTLDESSRAGPHCLESGPWTAQYLALRALESSRCLPGRGPGAAAGLAGRRLARCAPALRAHAQAWRPWRGYAVMHLWRDAMAPNPVPRRALPGGTPQGKCR